MIKNVTRKYDNFVYWFQPKLGKFLLKLTFSIIIQNRRIQPKTTFWGHWGTSGRVSGHFMTPSKNEWKTFFFHLWFIGVCLFPRETLWVSNREVWPILSGQNSWLVNLCISAKVMIISGKKIYGQIGTLPQINREFFES